MTTVTVVLDVYEHSSLVAIELVTLWTPGLVISCTEVTLHYNAYTSVIVLESSPGHIATEFESGS